MGRKRKLLEASNKNLTKAEIEERQAQEDILHSNYDKLELDIPNVLKGDRLAVNEWRRIVPLLEKLPISSLDLYSVAQYCTYTSIYYKASKSLAREGLIMDGKENPNYNIMVKASKELKGLSGVLGLTIDSRLRLVVPTEIEKVIDPFADLLDGE